MSETALEIAKKQFADVKLGFDVNKSLQYNLGVDALQSTLRLINTPEVLQFADKYLYQIVNILLDQSPAKLGAFEKGKIVESLNLTIEILLRLLPSHPQFVHVLARVFEMSSTFYSGSKTYYHHYPGFPVIRVELAAKFATHNGFMILYNALYVPETRWPGAAVILNFIKILNHEEVCSIVGEEFRVQFLEKTMAVLLNLSDEQYKKENCDSITSLLRAMCHLYLFEDGTRLKHSDAKGIRKLDPYYTFWLSFIQRLMSSGSLVVKLFAWDVAQDLVAYAMDNRPFPKSYIVEGGSLSFVNGTYDFIKMDKGSPVYEKMPSRPSDPIVQLLRFNMKDKTFRWFLSTVKLGSQDIDYYEDITVNIDRRLPSSREWSGVGQYVNAFPPVVKRGTAHLTEGITDDILLTTRITKWAIENDVFSQIFGSNMHREIIARSDKLLTFLADYDAITSAHVNQIWKAAMLNTAEDVSDELWTLLVGLSVYLDVSLFQVLYDLAIIQLHKDETGYGKVASFIERYCRDQYKYLQSIQRNNSASLLLNLVWEAYKSPFFSGLKSSTVIQDLLSRCLQFKCGNTFVLERIQESAILLQNIRKRCIEKVNQPSDETNASQIILNLMFLTSKQIDENVVTQLNKEYFPKIIINEIYRFIEMDSNRDQNDASTHHAIGIANRLHILRRFFGLSQNIRISINEIETLWNILSKTPDDVNEFLTFLMNGAQAQDEIRPFCDNDVLVRIFQTYICSELIDWKLCDDSAFNCFNIYFQKLREMSALFRVDDRDRIVNQGIRTLWRIALNISSDISTRSAMESLLTSFDDASLSIGPRAYHELLSGSFSRLIEITGKTSPNNNGSYSSLSMADTVRVERCIGILHEAILRARVDNDPSHAIRGVRSRIIVKVYYKKVNTFYNYNTRSEILTPVKGSEGSADIDVHPFHTVYMLKKKVMDIVGFGESSSVSLTFHKKILESYQRLCHCDIVDGSEIVATLKVHMPKYTNMPYEREHEYLGTQSSIGLLISDDKEKFDILLKLCNMLLDKPSIVQKIWEIIMLVPTKFELWHQVFSNYKSNSNIDVNEDEISPVKWLELCQSNELSLLAYYLQIVDNILQPAQDCESSLNYDQLCDFRSNFIAKQGFRQVTEIFLAISSGGHLLHKEIVGASLHIIHFCLFYQERTQSDIDLDTSLPLSDVSMNDVKVANQGLMNELITMSTSLVEKLLKVAGEAASSQDSSTVQDSLALITALLQSKEVAATLINNPQSKVLLATVLRGASKKVRILAADFAVQFGLSQSVVFKWLLSVLDNLPPNDDKCVDIFRASLTLLSANSEDPKKLDDYVELGQLLSTKLLAYTTSKQIRQSEKLVLHGFLELLAELVSLHVDSVLNTDFGNDILSTILSKFLFSLPSKSDSSSSEPICDTQLTKQAAFKVLLAMVSAKKSSVVTIISHIEKLCQQASSRMMFNWEMMLSQDVKRPDIEYIGLKNQGCTCYSNSFLQQLFMNVSFRNAILMTPLLEHHRTTLWHKSDEELVGMRLLFEFRNGSWHPGEVTAYNPLTKKHSVIYNEYRQNQANPNPIHAEFNIREGRKDFETGRLRVLPPEGSPPISEREDGANRVLEQLQRAFCFMEYSKKRFYDPRPLVEACKTLNLNFDVYHQNDAAEFCDQLLDRVETATKGTFTKRNIWDDVLKKKVFGGNFLTQKIPSDCDTYQSDKKSCGHWQSSKKESFLKVELIIRGKETIDESLRELVQGELMDGDNKIHCDVCSQKKATIRRTCIETLPNTLIVHLKRFDLDFQTFETVKLNSKLEFPVKLNVLKYTKDGMEYEERKSMLNAQESGNTPADAISPDSRSSSSFSSGTGKIEQTVIQYEEPLVEPDANDFEYELQGVLVHSGVAQGGHYYSFIKDGGQDPKSNNQNEKWYRFDDDDVSPFTADQIPYQCFGGSSNNNSSVSNFHDDERTSNALMLFYTKVQSSIVESPSKEEINMNGNQVQKNDDGLVLVDGYQAFIREVHESNLQHVLSCHLLDSDLHGFVRDILSKISIDEANIINSMDKMNVNTTSPLNSIDILPLEAFQFAIKFLFDIILHCRERSGTKSWQLVFQQHFENHNESAVWYLKELVLSDKSWLREYLLNCSDFLSRSTFVQVTVSAISSLPALNIGLMKDYNSKIDSIENGDTITRQYIAKEKNAKLEAVIVLLIRQLVKYVMEVPLHLRNADELFVIIRDLASIPSIRYILNINEVIAKLSYFIIPDAVHPDIRDKFIIPNVKGRTRPDYYMLYGGILEAVAALLGVPQVRKVNLLQDSRSYWERQLVPEAREALTLIFHEVSVNGVMDANQLSHFLEKINGQKPHQSNIKHMIDTNGGLDGKMNLEGFIQCFTEKAGYAAKEVWAIFTHYGYRNDLTRVRGPDSKSSLDDSSASLIEGLNFSEYGISQYSQVCLMNIGLYEAGMESNEEVTKTIVQRVCVNNDKFSCRLITMTTKKLLEECQVHSWGNKIEAIQDFIIVILKIDDNASYVRVREALLNKDAGYLNVIRSERQRPSICRANDYDQRSVMSRYVEFVQNFCKIDIIAKNIRRVLEEEPSAREVRGMLRLRPDSTLTEDEEASLKRISIQVSDAGVPEVNGIYRFVDVMFEAGFYAREGQYKGKPVRYTMYKCNVTSGQYQWFISITPENMNPGTSNDTDFYMSPGHRGTNDRYPPKQWTTVNNRNGVGQAPTITYITNDTSGNVLNDVVEGQQSPEERDVYSNQNFEFNANSLDDSRVTRRPGGFDLNSLHDPRLGSTQEVDSTSDPDSNTMQIDQDDDIDLLVNNSPSRGSTGVAPDDDLIDDGNFQHEDDFDQVYDSR